MALDLDYILMEKTSLLEKARVCVGSDNAFYCKSFRDICEKMQKDLPSLRKIEQALLDNKIETMTLITNTLLHSYGINIPRYKNLEELKSDLEKAIKKVDVYLKINEKAHREHLKWSRFIRTVRSCNANAIGKSLHKPKVPLVQHTYTKKKIR